MMKDAATLLKLICDIINGLSEEEISALIEKRARLKVQFPERQKSSREAVELTDDFFRELDSAKTRESAKELFARFPFRKAQLLEIVRHYSISVTAKDNNATIIDRIIESVVGSKLKHETLLTANLHRSE
ncbi:MAG: hypothetical protein IJR48_04310 [Oscillibacter sp.]|nr:hypothetical protein [Oscillibacter sp.]MBQ9617568.1 hypothetical protein [Oscillibacter sp.]